jgi:transposase InsO family protein
MKKYYKDFSIKSMAEALEVSREAYYKSLRIKDQIKIEKENILKDAIYKIWEDSLMIYGLRRILEEVKKIYPEVGKRKVRRLMKELKIKGKKDIKFKVSTTDSNHNLMVAPNILDRKFCVSEPNQAWVSDVTFIRCKYGWLYLCVIIDLFSRKVVGRALSNVNDAELILKTLQRAVNKRNPKSGLIFHSDRGSNYCSKKVIDYLEMNHIIRSNSRKGNCWDNSVSESFFSTIKREMPYNVFHDLENATFHVFSFIDDFYNCKRIHSYLGYVNPDRFEYENSVN